MKHLYKMSPKDFIKQHYKTIGDILIWVGLLLCIILCAIYTSRKIIFLDNEKNEPNVQLIQRSAVNNENSYSYYSLKSQSFLLTTLDTTNNTYDYESYIDAHTHTQNWGEVVTYISIYDGDFWFYDIDTQHQFTQLQFRFTYSAEQDILFVSYIYLVGEDRANDMFLYDRNGPVYNYITLKVNNYRFVSSSSVNEVYHGSILDFYFDKVLSDNDTSVYQLDFSQNPNFNQLLTYYRVGVYDFTYTGNPAGSWYTLPITFIYNNVLYESIMFNTIYVVNYLADSQTIKNYTDITGETTQYIMTCSSVYFVEYGGTTHVQSDTSGNVMRPPTLVGDCLQVAYREVAYYSQDNNFSGGSTAIYPVWNMYKGWNTYNRVSYDMYISSDSLETIPYPNNDSASAHFPLNNLTNIEILELIATDLGRVYGGNITGDVGLGQVFTLYKDAFGSLVGLMAIQVIPGITLGLLLFLPLVGTIIIVIIRLVKK